MNLKLMALAGIFITVIAGSWGLVKYGEARCYNKAQAATHKEEIRQADGATTLAKGDAKRGIKVKEKIKIIRMSPDKCADIDAPDNFNNALGGVRGKDKSRGRGKQKLSLARP